MRHFANRQTGINNLRFMRATWVSAANLPVHVSDKLLQLTGWRFGFKMFHFWLSVSSNIHVQLLLLTLRMHHSSAQRQQEWAQPQRVNLERRRSSETFRQHKFINKHSVRCSLINTPVSHWSPGESERWQPADALRVSACPAPHGAVRTDAWWFLPGWVSAGRS